VVKQTLRLLVQLGKELDFINKPKKFLSSQLPLPSLGEGGADDLGPSGLIYSSKNVGVQSVNISWGLARKAHP
jgi:hypothetical protein